MLLLSLTTGLGVHREGYSWRPTMIVREATGTRWNMENCDLNSKVVKCWNWLPADNLLNVLSLG